jgi:hypothetical protein
MTSAQARLPYPPLKGRATDFVPLAQDGKFLLLEVRSSVRPEPRKGRNLDSHSLGIRINVWLRQPHSQCAHPVEGGNPLEDGMSKRFLEIVSTRASQLGDLGTKEVVIPRFRRMILRRRRNIIQPDLDGDQEPLRRSNFELVETDVRLHRQPLEKDAR